MASRKAGGHLPPPAEPGRGRPMIATSDQMAAKPTPACRLD